MKQVISTHQAPAAIWKLIAGWGFIFSLFKLVHLLVKCWHSLIFTCEAFSPLEDNMLGIEIAFYKSIVVTIFIDDIGVDNACVIFIAKHFRL